MRKNYMLVDLFSGSYVKEHKGNEDLNDKRNKVTGKYYGYVPPKDDPKISRLGASETDEYIDDVLVVFVKKTPDGSINRMVTGFYPSARVYKENQFDDKLERFITEEDGTQKSVSYTLESDEYFAVSPEHTLVIETGNYKPYLFRPQRVYGDAIQVKYPDLDVKILDYIERLINGYVLEDDIIEQQELQEVVPASDQAVQEAPNRELQFEDRITGKGVKRNSQLTKSAIIAAKYKCEANSKHITFLNRHGKPYMEGHHLIPCTVKNAKEIKERFDRNIDCTQNIVSLCPTCHRAIHVGSKSEKKQVLSAIISKRLPVLKKVGIDLTEVELLRMYGV